MFEISYFIRFHVYINIFNLILLIHSKESLKRRIVKTNKGMLQA